MKKLIIVFLLIPLLNRVSAQSIYQLDNIASDMTIVGTSTLHDWESDVEEMSGTIMLTTDGDRLKKLGELTMTIAVNSIKSGKSGMDKDTYTALNEKEFPSITYKLLSADSSSDEDVRARGELTIAGTSNSIELITQYVVEDRSISFSGVFTFNMSEFNIEPPKALFGMIKAGDEVTIQYDVVFNKE